MPSNTSLSGTTSKTRAIRIAKSLDRVLEQEAKKRNISINGLISYILTQFGSGTGIKKAFAHLPYQIKY